MTKASFNRIQRLKVRKAARAEAEKIGPAEARRKLAEWAARGGDIEALKTNAVRQGRHGRTERPRLFGPGGIMEPPMHNGVPIREVP